MFFITVDGIVDLTDDFNYTTDTVLWGFEVLQVWIDDVNEPTFTYNLKTKVLSVPSTAPSETVKARFRLYLVSGSSEIYAPSDPTNPMSPYRVWFSGLVRSPSVTVSIDNLERGYGVTSASNLELLIDTYNQELRGNNVVFDLQDVFIYKNSALIVQATVTSVDVASSISLNIQKPNIELEQLATFGDPDYLVRIDPSHSSSYYTGSNIPERYHGMPIPMIYGSSTPYNRTERGSADSGTVIGTPLNPPLVGPISYDSVVSVIKPIPIDSSTLLIGKIPSYQSLVANNITYSPTTIVRTLTKIQSYTSIPNYFAGQAVDLIRTSPSELDLGIILDSQDIYTTVERTSGTFVYDSVKVGLNVRIVTADPTKKLNPFPTVSVSQTTPSGHRLIKLSFGAGLDDLRTETPYVIIENMTGARSGPKVIQHILESHNIGVVTSGFTSADTAVSDIVNVISGIDGAVPKISSLIKSINNSVFGAIVQQKNTPNQQYILYSTGTPSTTLTEDQIKGLKVTSSGREILNKILFKSEFITQEALQDTVNVTKSSTYGLDVVGSLSQEEKTHVFQTSASRLNDIMTHYGNVQKTVEFTLLDEDVSINLGDTLTISHYYFSGNIFITEIRDLDLGKQITGRVLKI